MSKMLLTIQHNGILFSPPIKDGVKIEWERVGSPGKLTFTTVNTSDGLTFTEGDLVSFYYDEKPVFMGFVFTKKFDKERNIEVTCYDQLRYLKNKFTYVFENKTATQIIKALCSDFDLNVGDMDDTKYVIPAVAEENKSALDIILTVLEETLVNTGEQFVFYDDFGKLRVSNIANMVSPTLICEDTAENFDYKSSIDEETYNQIVLYYKQNDQITQMYTTQSPSTIAKWGMLRYFEEVKNPTIGQNKADALLKLYNKKKREFKVTKAFGDITVRGGTLIPVVLDLDNITVQNFMRVEKITHNFDYEHYTMDLTLEGAWENPEYDGVSKTVGELLPENTGGGYGGYVPPKTTEEPVDETPKVTEKVPVMINVNGDNACNERAGITYFKNGKCYTEPLPARCTKTYQVDKGTLCKVQVERVPSKVYNGRTYSTLYYEPKITPQLGSWTNRDTRSPNLIEYNTYVREYSWIRVTWNEPVYKA